MVAITTITLQLRPQKMPSDISNSAHKRCPVATCGKPFCEFSEIDEEGETIQTFMFQLSCSVGNNSEPG